MTLHSVYCLYLNPKIVFAINKDLDAIIQTEKKGL